MLGNAWLVNPDTREGAWVGGTNRVRAPLRPVKKVLQLPIHVVVSSLVCLSAHCKGLQPVAQARFRFSCSCHASIQKTGVTSHLQTRG